MSAADMLDRLLYDVPAAVVATAGTTPSQDVAAPAVASRVAGVSSTAAAPGDPQDDTTQRAHSAGPVNTSDGVNTVAAPAI